MIRVPVCPSCLHEKDSDDPVAQHCDDSYHRRGDSQLERQVGGSHYLGMTIQPMTYIMANGLPWAEGDIVKYVSRWRAKNGVEDLRKAAHLLAVLIEANED